MNREKVTTIEKNHLTDGDIVLVDGVSGIYRNGTIELSNGESTDKEPDYIIRVPAALPEVLIENTELPTLEIGDKSMFTEIMQVCLKWRGYKITPDGDFGTLTFQALRDFREDCYLSGDTVCDSATWQKLFDY